MADVVPVLSQLNIVAKDFDATLDFYRRLGVGVPVWRQTYLMERATVR
jgi:hypothetical protein